MNHEQATQLMDLLSRLTNDGTPLQAVLGDKFELGVTLLTCAMVSNEKKIDLKPKVPYWKK